MSSKSYFKYETFNYDSKGNYLSPFPFPQQYILNDYLNSLNLNTPSTNNNAYNSNGLSVSSKANAGSNLALNNLNHSPSPSKSPCTISTTPLHINFNNSGGSGNGGENGGTVHSASFSPNVNSNLMNSTLPRAHSPPVAALGSLNNLTNFPDDYRPPNSTSPHYLAAGNNTLRYQYGTLKIREREHHRDKEHRENRDRDFRHHERGDYLSSTLKHRHSLKGHSKTRTYQVKAQPHILFCYFRKCST